MNGESNMRLRSQVPKTEKPLDFFKKRRLEEEEILNRPVIDYGGKINYCTTFFDCALLCDELLKKANTTEDFVVFGFDLEWPFSFKTGSQKTAVMQINVDIDNCHIIHMSALDKVPKNLSELLAHPRVCLTGVNIKNDIRKLSRDFTGFDGDAIIKNCVELSTFANSVLPCQQRWSLEKLVGFCFKMNINKDKSVRMSKWNVVPLSENQMLYAAIDSYASLKLYQHLKELEVINEKERHLKVTQLS